VSEGGVIAIGVLLAIVFGFIVYRGGGSDGGVQSS
jgi:high-affinity Fe2+/Pb2+ permease